MVTPDLSGVKPFVGENEVSAEDAKTVADALNSHAMNGWVDLPRDFVSDEIMSAAKRLRGMSGTLVVCGAGGSSLGARALINALGRADAPNMLYTGDNLSGVSMARLVNTLRDGDFTVVASSKSGTTTETLAAFRVLLSLLTDKHGDRRAFERVTVVTEPKKSPLRLFAEERGCATFEIPANVGGRYSVFTPANLIPAAVCGVDIGALVGGAREQCENGFNDALKFAVARNRLYDAGYTTELFACFEPVLESFGLWWRQLFGESEGKNGGGTFPATVSYTGDLHSMGQYVQNGRRDLFETVVLFAATDSNIKIPDGMFADGLNHLTGRAFAEINDLTRTAVLEAHFAGSVPVAEVRAGAFGERAVGELMQFFMTACAASCFLRGIDPFDQPGVEAYKSRARRQLTIDN